MFSTRPSDCTESPPPPNHCIEALRAERLGAQCLGERELKIATTVNASIWSALMSIGGALGGLITTQCGISTNFAVDACTYLSSAALTLAMGAPSKQLEGGSADQLSPGSEAGRASADGSDSGGGNSTPLTEVVSGADSAEGEPPPPLPPPLPYSAPLGARLCDALCFPRYVTATANRDDGGGSKDVTPLW
jgi:hypothetical protein